MTLAASFPTLSRRAVPLLAFLASLGVVAAVWPGLTLACALAAGAGLVVALLRLRPAGQRRRLTFTRDGKVLVVLTLGVGVGAINTGNNLLYLMLGMLLSLIVISGVLSEQTLRRLRVERALPESVQAGRPFLAALTLHNEKRRVPSYSVQVEDLIEGAATAKRCYFLKVPAGARQDTSYRGQFERRGQYHYTRIRIATRFPFAFFVKVRTVSAPATLLVLPRIHPVAELPLAARGLLGTFAQRRKGQGREFHGLRQWRDGDDARDIHWRRTAREGRLILREYERDAAQQVGLYLPLAAGALEPDDPALDALVDLAASLIVHLQQPGPGRPGHDVTLQLGHDRMRLNADGRGRHAAMRRLALAAFTPGPAEPANLPPQFDWILVCAPETAAALGPSRFAHVFEGA